jgi:transformation/transcription domain-associated protein
VANFLVQMMIILADSKAETSTKDLEAKTGMLLSTVLQKWQMCQIHSANFEKVVSMCIEEIAANKVQMSDASDKKTREKAKARGPARTIGRAKSVSSKSSQSPGAGREDPQPASNALLCVCLEVFTVLVSLSPDNPFFVVNPRIVNDILEVCFLRAKHQDGKGIRKRLKEFLVPFLIAGLNKQIHHPGIDLRVQVLLEKCILNSESEFRHIPESLQAPDNTRKSDGRSSSFDDGRVGSPCLALFSLDIILEVSEVSLSFVESFTGSLVTLTEELVAGHLQETRSVQKGTGTAYRLQHPTATCGILDEAVAASRKRRKPLNEAKFSSKADPDLRHITELSISLRSIIACIRLVSLTDLPYRLGKTRQIFMQTVGSILDSGDNIQLLLTVIGIIGKWLVSEDGRGPLAFDEKITLLRKISSLDSRQAPPIVAQSVADLVGSIVLAIADQGKLDHVFPVETPASDVINTVELHGGGFALSVDSPRTIFHRAVTACILSAHSSVRKRALSFFWGQAGEAKDDCNESLPTSVGKSVFDMLWKLLHSDFEAVGGRMWPLIFVEALLSGCLSKPVARSGGDCWVPRPNCSPYIGSTAGVPQACLGSFFEFMVKFKEPTEARLVSVLCLSHWDQSLIQKLFESLLVSAWSEVSSDDARALLIRPMEQLMSRPYNSQNFINSHAIANSVQSMLMACRKLHPQPAFDPELLVTLGGMYRAIHDVVTILEQESTLLRSRRDTVSQKVWSGICACLQQLGEQNLVLGLTQKLCWQGETSYVLSLDIHGLISEAITGYSNLVDLAETRSENDVFLPSDFEMDMWENRWAHLQKEMGQLKVVAEFASLSGDHSMLLDAAWKNQDWDKVDALKSSPELNALYERGDPSLKVSEMLSAIMRGKLSEVENLHAQTAQLCLQQWQSLSSLANGSHQHSALLHFFHRLVEFRESGQIMVEITNHSNRRTLPDLQNLLR